ncbi:MAG: glycosyltransferase family 4 protein [Candidatus Kariarchaeaceae archaeon]|jgi:glycosyltransferase involved in cell wall biosynthesis
MIHDDLKHLNNTEKSNYLKGKTSSLPKALLVGGPDIDLRLDLILQLKDKFNFEILGTSPSIEEKISKEGYEYHNYIFNRQINPLMDLVSIIQLIYLFRKLNPQIVHTFSAKQCALFRIAARISRVPVVIGTLTGLSSLYVNNGFSIRLVRKIYEKLQKFSSKISDLTIFQNNDDYHRYISEGIVSEHKAIVIPGSGVSTELYNPARISKDARIQLREELGLKMDDIVVTLVSRVIRTKGVLEFMDAAKNMRLQNPRVRFLLIGHYDDDNIHRLNPDEVTELKQSVIWPGRRNDIPVVLAASDIFVFPSFHMEGIPRVLLEAASMQLPIITTDISGCNDVVEDGVNGFFVPAHDSDALVEMISRLIDQPDLRDSFGLASRQFAQERFDLSIISDQTSDIYYRLLVDKGYLEFSQL